MNAGSSLKIRTMKYVLFYEAAPDGLAKVPANAAAHRERWEGFGQRGVLLMIGPFADPREGAMGIFTTRAAAEEFAAEDPFVVNGVVSRWHVREWNEALA